jgi:hypothetical protein
MSIQASNDGGMYSKRLFHMREREREGEREREREREREK